MPYIYKITNLINGKMYIGKTSNTIEERWLEHLRDSRKERCEKRPLYDAFNKYGIENFKIEEIEKVENDEIACKKEIYWIDKLRTYIGFEDYNGYNATLGGDSKRYYNYKELANTYLELGTVKAVTEKFNCDPDTVKYACEENGIEINRKTNRIFDYTKLAQAYLELGTTKAVADKFNCSLDTIRKACKENNIDIPCRKKGKKVNRISKDKEIKEYNSITEAALDLSNDSKVNAKIETLKTYICKSLKEKKEIYGYKYEYTN